MPVLELALGDIQLEPVAVHLESVVPLQAAPYAAVRPCDVAPSRDEASEAAGSYAAFEDAAGVAAAQAAARGFGVDLERCVAAAHIALTDLAGS